MAQLSPQAAAPFPERGIAPDTLRRALRTATAPAHRTLDERFKGLGDGSISSYREFVRMNHACHSVLETWLDATLPNNIKNLRQRFDGFLASDMAELGLQHITIEPFRLPRPSLPEAAGVLYVIDGSRLGARLIARTPALRAEIAQSYVTAAARPCDVFAAFNALCGSLEESNIARSIDAAHTTFSLFAQTSADTYF